MKKTKGFEYGKYKNYPTNLPAWKNTRAKNKHIIYVKDYYDEKIIELKKSGFVEHLKVTNLLWAKKTDFSSNGKYEVILVVLRNPLYLRRFEPFEMVRRINGVILLKYKGGKME